MFRRQLVQDLERSPPLLTGEGTQKGSAGPANGSISKNKLMVSGVSLQGAVSRSRAQTFATPRDSLNAMSLLGLSELGVDEGGSNPEC